MNKHPAIELCSTVGIPDSDCPGKLLQERIQRARFNQNFPEADFNVDNSGELENAIDQFLSYLIRVVKM